MTVHITPGPTPTLRHYGVCPVCEQQAWMVGATQEWYDTVWSCCRCGDSWTLEGLLPRPFRPGWRNEHRRHATRQWWYALLGQPTPW